MKIYVNNKEIDIEICKSFIKKTKGLMGKKNIKSGILLVKCNSIHTFFMKDKIDVIMTDKNYKILHIYTSLPKNKIIFPKKNVYYIFELPKNTVKNIKINTKLKIEE